MSLGLSQGALQSNGQMVPEATFDVEHVAQTIVHIANLPTSVTVLDYKIMYGDICYGEDAADLLDPRATKMPFVGRG